MADNTNGATPPSPWPQLPDIPIVGPVEKLGNRTLWGVPPLPLTTPFAEMGSGGTPVWGGYIQIKDESPKWQGRERWRIASELAVNTSVVAAGVHYFLNLIAHPQWTAIPSSDGGIEAKEMADFVDEVLSDTIMPWANIVRHAGMYRFHGFAIQEWIAKHILEGRFAGTIGLCNIESRPQHTIEQWAIDDHGSVLGMFQRNPQTNALLGLPRNKLWYIVEDTLTDSPEGVGVFRHMLEPYARLKRFIDLEARAYERDLRGIPVGRAPLAAINQAVAEGRLTSAQAQTLVEGIKAMIQTQVKQSDTGLLLDSQPYFSTTTGGPTVSEVMQWSFELLNGPGLGLVEISAAIDRVQREMARIMGVEHLMIGDAGGSRAVAQDKSRNIYLIASSVLRNIIASAQKDIIGPLWALNGFDDRLKPKLRAEDIAPRDVVEIATTLARMAQSGAVLAPDDPAVNDVRDLLGISRVTPLIEENPILTEEDGSAPDLPRMLPSAQGEVNPRAAGTGELDAEGNPLISPELQRLPRETAVMRDPAELPKRLMRKQEKVPKAEVNYQGKPNGSEQCAKCTMFLPPNSCTDVRGRISRNGWCELFELRSVGEVSDVDDDKDSAVGNRDSA